ncbi:peptide-methionine (S)-S-oxide reductase MsrA [Terriglobus albidus]|uniref:peptide-methionine (S)-S-oxide reductase MsrA n=1 Tax=Terriglobus albidus TaxID=1592106 RepID=UPI0021DFC8D1|nr:peptide-methionine (S)-S-oxide reductase MsrA [Terriglobus albidus]
MRKLSRVLAGMLGVLTLTAGAATKQPIPAPTHDVALATTHGRQTAVFAGGCFWGTQAVFQRLKGVLHTTAGYSGGTKETANYGQVVTETTDHAESVEVVYDPARITYGTLLRIFFSVAHDPTQLNRQDNDIGYSYRSAIFYANEEQRKLAADYIAQLDAAHVFHGKIVTKLSPLQAFYPGEDYHQDYALKNPGNPYIQVCDLPKIAALKKQFPDLFVEYNGHYQQ